MTYSGKTLFFLLSFLALASPAFAHDGESRPAVGRAFEVKEVTLAQKLNSQIPLNLVFTDENGSDVTLSQYFDGKAALLALVYYECPQLCPLVLEGLARSLRPLDFEAGEDYRVIAVSIDPQETPEVARRKKDLLMARLRPQGASGWHLLTGSQNSVETLAEAVGFRYRENADTALGRYSHAIGAMVITPNGRISRYFYGFDYPPRDLRLSLIEASGNRIGSPVDQLLLLCYKYDPTQGKYTISILNVLRLSGTATVLALGGFMVIMLRRERSGKIKPDRRRRGC